MTLLLPLPMWLATVLLIVGVWGVLLVSGLTAALVVYPHVLEPERLRLRIGFWTELAISREVVGRVDVQYGTVDRGLTVAEGRASLTPSGSVNLLLHLIEPLQVDGRSVTTIWAWVDAPASMRAELHDPAR